MPVAHLSYALHSLNAVLQIINGSVFLVGPVQNFQNRARTMQLSLMELQGKYKLPDLDAVFIMSDKCKHGQPAPYKDEGYAGKCERTVRPLSFKMMLFPVAFHDSFS